MLSLFKAATLFNLSRTSVIIFSRTETFAKFKCKNKVNFNNKHSRLDKFLEEKNSDSMLCNIF